MPLVRFKTGDVSFLIDEPCRCGRNSPRLGPILGRKNQMIKLRGTTFYPNSINAALDSYPGVSEYYVAASTGSDLCDEIKVFISVSDDSCSVEKIMDKLQAHLRVRPEVIIASEEQVKSQVYPGATRKPIRFVDKRTSI
jgi:phenylacetate-CoA ligase